ncbi:DUF1156 domain-containing protein [Raineyella sp. LH-20]|uniref:DUF1156 domain-containing protein n=1 Tax=Raineyella sp. LH-20 TaxID=3081204 RepID=UPI00295504E9|nr:DUF1156 domain-containing protein [Raineyella sp. LH-20]WOP19304.1 DUF1156 domain-containing protein [Raineyella sp. LH-20]
MTTTSDAPIRKKLIEVSIPLEDINAESAREKSIRYGHPSTLHLWWARRPLAAARAVLFAQLVDDPSSDPSLTEEQQTVERERLHNLIRRLVKWENVNDAGLMREAHEEILKSTGGNPPAILDPFAGGGTIPLEAQRLGLEAHASDLNPVAVLINKALIEIPPKFAGRPPVFPAAANTLGPWPRATGLAEDVRRYGAWMREQAKERIGHLYPDAEVVDEETGKKTTATTIAWIWARTVTCPNPACGIEMPLVRSWWLGKKKGKEAYVVPAVVEDPAAPGGRRIEFTIGHDKGSAPAAKNDGTVKRTGAICVSCGATADLNYVRSEGRAGRLSARLMTVVAEGARRRVYLAPTDADNRAAETQDVVSGPPGLLPPHSLSPNSNQTITIYGFAKFSDLFTARQLASLTSLSDLVGEARAKVVEDALAAGLPSSDRLADGGAGAEAYADAVATYLAFAISRTTNKSNALNSWDSSPKMEAVRGLFARQQIPMAWDFAESNPFGGSSGDFLEDLNWVCRSLENTPAREPGHADQADAATREYRGLVVSTDPPYYDNIGYSDLSDFFYVWLRRSLREVQPRLFASMLVPKAEELVANPHRHNGRDGAKRFFETGFENVFAHAREGASDDFPITVFYAFKQTDLDSEGLSNTGWASILEGMIRGGWSITATWPMRTELGNRMIASGTSALASSIVLVLRPRHMAAGRTSRRGFVATLKRELPRALEKMRQVAIAPVDLAQATIGPGMGVFSRYEGVVENDGSDMSVKTAIAVINQVVDEVLSEQEGDLDPTTRFCLTWYAQYGWAAGPSGDGISLSQAYGTSEPSLLNSGVLTKNGSTVQLVPPASLPATWNPATDHSISVWETAMHLVRVLSAEDGGLEAAAKLMVAAGTRPEIDVESVQRLAYRLYEMTQKSRPDDARLFNLLGGSWTDLTAAAGHVQLRPAVQDGFDFVGEV